MYSSSGTSSSNVSSSNIVYFPDRRRQEQTGIQNSKEKMNVQQYWQYSSSIVYVADRHEKTTGKYRQTDRVNAGKKVNQSAWMRIAQKRQRERWSDRQPARRQHRKRPQRCFVTPNLASDLQRVLRSVPSVCYLPAYIGFWFYFILHCCNSIWRHVHGIEKSGIIVVIYIQRRLGKWGGEQLPSFSKFQPVGEFSFSEIQMWGRDFF